MAVATWRSFCSSLRLASAVLSVLAWTWPIIVAFGQTIALFCNWAALAYVQHSLAEARARNISTVPKDNIFMTGYTLLKAWLPGSIYYCAVLWLFGTLIYWHVLHDIPAYAISIAAASIFVMYLIKCGINAPPIRVCLTRACLASERVRITFDGYNDF